MYPSRTERKKAKDQEKQTRYVRFWTVVNIGLIAVAAGLLVYYANHQEVLP
ncbi:hypothetical protein JJQ72_00955 [Paenibacillus sp. F411]|uniref:Uncharacterized protein n=1 Tax=Paenibacillus algicola TaxID=2565926 RepID=A0A4P8XL82_9BACL|nr:MULTISPECIES: hypothetical protein [Paenibacillus]MBO2942556.1 hypothetical protein [Paenibacillus sp. F411]QCT03506.1 hypothetical protein E6C60_2794 [Paenibacillus algicola]